MRDLAEKTAFITGGASGIGLAMGEVFAAAGMNVMLADIEADALREAVSNLCATGSTVRGVVCDVANYASVQEAAQATVAAFGKVHLVCNNAGVADAGGVDDIALQAWRWVIEVNLMGVVHGLKAFVPLLKRQGAGGHIVNTASMTGFVADAFGAYAAAKSGVIAISEALQVDLASSGIGVSLLCPSLVRTRILECLRNWPKDYGPPPMRDLGPLAGRVAELMRSAMPPSEVAAMVRKAVEDNEFYIFTHPERRRPLEERVNRFLAAYRKLDAVPQEALR